MISGILIRFAYWLRIRRVKDSTLYPLARKICAFKLHEHEVHTLVLGSSHAQMGYLAKKGEFNLGLASQDLYYTYELYRRYGMHVRDIVVFYSVFSGGSYTLKTNYAVACDSYKVVAGIDWPDETEAKKRQLHLMLGAYRRKMQRLLRRNSVNCDDLGNEELYCPFFASSAEERAKAHLKSLHRDIDMGIFLERLIGEAMTRGQRVWVVIPPACQGYRKVVNAVTGPFDRAWSAANKYENATVLDYFNDKDFNDGDFIDFDHLGKAGAAKMSAKIRADVERRSVNNVNTL